MATIKKQVAVYIGDKQRRDYFPARPADVVGHHDYNYYIVAPQGEAFRCFVFYRSRLVHTSRHLTVFDAEKHAKSIINEQRERARMKAETEIA